ncbi:location of vulva defective 1-like [Ruditapes philippinarum]|uniref:location of vulva defective 1-like n=1 Tax=Ruditapes philippinarum TaxID=129788 RepID=UPI00295A8D21|nr:location of vulva defective 1-like [Ruditapes philippinarum]
MFSCFSLYTHSNLHFSVNSEYFEFGDKGTACILLDIDASFNLTYNDGTTFEAADIFDLNGATVVNRSSLCSDSLFKNNSLLMISLFPSGEHVEFSFRRQFGDILMHVALFLNPGKHFMNINNTLPVEMKDYMGFNVGKMASSNNSFECHTAQDLHFRFDAPFDMTMTISNIQVQAYSVTNSTFGPAKECKQDLMTTIEPSIITTVTEPRQTTSEPSDITTVTEPRQTTTEPSEITTATEPRQTTTEPSDITTATEPRQTTTFEPDSTTWHSHTTEPPMKTSTETNVDTTEPHTTSSATTVPITTKPRPTTRPKFIVKNNGTVCIVIEGFIMFDIPYKKKDNTNGISSNITVPNDADVQGNCHLNTSAQEITITFFDASWVLDIIIMKGAGLEVADRLEGSGNTYTWNKLNLSYTIDSHFPEADKPGSKESVTTSGAIANLKVNTDGSFKCNAEEDINVDKDTHMKLSDLQYRAFGKTGTSDFTNNDVTECAADHHPSGGGGGDGGDGKLGIILGCVFGGLAVIILVVGGVRYRRKTGNVSTGANYDPIT